LGLNHAKSRPVTLEATRGVKEFRMSEKGRFVLTASLLVAIAVGVASAAGEPPRAPVKRVVNTYWGVQVVDDYQYLEDMEDPEVKAWVREENAYTREWLDAYPGRDLLAARVRELLHSGSSGYFDLKCRAGTLFAMKHQPPRQQPFLIVVNSLDDPDSQRVAVDPNVIDPSGGTTIDFYEPSLDGRYVAVSLSKDGTEDGTVRVYNVANGQALPDAIPRVNGGTAGGSVAWTANGKGLYYTRYPYPGERPAEDLPFYQRIWFHTLGTGVSADRYVLGESFPRIAEIDLHASADGTRTLAEVSNGDGGEYEYWIHSPGGDWARLARFEDDIQQARFGPDGAVYLLSRRDAPRKKILRLAPDASDLAKAETVIPESDAAIESFTVGAEHIYVIEMWGGPTWLQVYDLRGRAGRKLDMGGLSSVTGLVVAGGNTALSGGGDGISGAGSDRDVALFRSESYTQPPAWYRYETGMGSPLRTALETTSPADYSDCEVRRESATADDGTAIPINIILRKGTPQDGTAPLLLTAYGSYGISQRPSFAAERRIWIEQGGIYAIANVRGGGEFGEAWHAAARLEHKKVTMDDLAACARYLVKQGYTTPKRLAIRGGSAGGLLVYGTMVYYPDLMGAVVAHVGIGDALRTELSPNGEFNVTEFGTVKDETQFHGLYAASPYHHIQDGVAYPAVLARTGMNDPRVEPWQSFKMAARLQATGTPNPVLLRVSMKTGHGGGTALSEQEAQIADVYSFLFRVFGMEYRRMPGAKRAE
jgi:prolyl oligopeptidase